MENAVSESEFAAVMSWLGPFERNPLLAVAVSGGADSICLALLSQRWARTRGGSVVALTVDHGLRPESAAEAVQVARWMRDSGIAHRTLSWLGTKPTTAIQSTARNARYQLMEDWCRLAGVWHLLVGHHREDQTETVVLRLERGSRRDGLAAMPALSERPSVRLLRPLIEIPSGRLRQTLVEAGQDWIEDPSNRNRIFARVRVRDALDADPHSSDKRDRLAGVAVKAAGLRTRDERTATELLARVATIHPAGFVLIEKREFFSAPALIRQRVLARIAHCVSGRQYAPRRAAIERLADAIHAPDFGGRTLGGCHFTAIADKILICREERNLEPPVSLCQKSELKWDGRFRVEAASANFVNDLMLGALGRDGWRVIVAEQPELRGCGIPAPARWSLPALRDPIGIFAVPHLGYNRDEANSWDFGIRRLCWEPRSALAQTPLWLAPSRFRPI